MGRSLFHSDCVIHTSREARSFFLHRCTREGDETQQQQQQRPPRDDGARRQTPTPGDAAGLRVRAATAPRTAQVDESAATQERERIASGAASGPAMARAQSDPLQALVAQWADRPLLLESSLAAQWTERYLRTGAAAAQQQDGS